MNGSENSSLKEKSTATEGTSLSAENVDRELSEALKKWENIDSTVVRSGTGCKCGAHTSAVWEKGGREWLVKHVSEVHAKEIDWKALIREALAMSPTEGAAFLTALVDAEDEKNKETLSNA